MAAEPRSSESPDGPRRAPGRAAGERATGGHSRRGKVRVAYRCGACGEEFVDDPGPAPCPRCQSVGDHDTLGRAGGERDGR